MEAELRHKLFPPNAWMKVLHFNVLTSCPKDELHQWLIGLCSEHIIPAIVHRYTKVLQRPDLVTVDKDGNSHPLLSNEAVVRFLNNILTVFAAWFQTDGATTCTPFNASSLNLICIEGLCGRGVILSKWKRIASMASMLRCVDIQPICNLSFIIYHIYELFIHGIYQFCYENIPCINIF